MWSDETKINRFISDGLKWVWIESMEHLDQRAIEETVKFGGGNIILWGCMTWDGPGFISKINGGMDAALYVDIIDECVPLTLDWYNMNKKTFYFQHDNDPKHTAKISKEYLQAKGWKILDWPAQSPDLNPIEHLWRHVKLVLSKYEHPPINEEEHWDRIRDAYYDIAPHICQTLIRSMPARIRAVLRNKGRHTKYSRQSN